MIDPKMLELSVYDGIPHLLTPVVTEPAQGGARAEMGGRARWRTATGKMAKIGVRNIDGFNERVRDATAKGKPLGRRVQTGFDPDTGEAIYEEEQLDSSRCRRSSSSSTRWPT